MGVTHRYSLFRVDVGRSRRWGGDALDRNPVTDGARRGVIDRFEDASKMVILISDVIALLGSKQMNLPVITPLSIANGNAC